MLIILAGAFPLFLFARWIAANQARHCIVNGQAALSSGQTDKALAAFSRAVRLDPANADAWSFQGIAFGRLGKLAPARQSLAKAVALRPRFPEALFSLGLIDVRSAMEADAVAMLRRYVSLRPKDTEGWLALASAEAQSDLSRAAIADVTRSLLIDPGQAPAYFLRADQAALVGAPDQIVITDARQGLALDPNFALGYYLLGRAELHAGDAAAGAADLTRALLLKPDPALARQCHYLRAQAEIRTGQTEAAQRDVRLSRTLLSGPGSRDRLP